MFRRSGGDYAARLSTIRVCLIGNRAGTGPQQTTKRMVSSMPRFVAIVLAAVVMVLIMAAMVDPRVQIGISIDRASLP
jgi:hypothetical protein